MMTFGTNCDKPSDHEANPPSRVRVGTLARGTVTVLLADFWKTVKGFKGMGFKDNRLYFFAIFFEQAEGVAKQGL